MNNSLKINPAKIDPNESKIKGSIIDVGDSFIFSYKKSLLL